MAGIWLSEACTLFLRLVAQDLVQGRRFFLVGELERVFLLRIGQADPGSALSSSAASQSPGGARWQEPRLQIWIYRRTGGRGSSTRSTFPEKILSAFFVSRDVNEIANRPVLDTARSTGREDPDRRFCNPRAMDFGVIAHQRRKKESPAPASPGIQGIQTAAQLNISRARSF